MRQKPFRGRATSNRLGDFVGNRLIFQCFNALTPLLGAVIFSAGNCAGKIWHRNTFFEFIRLIQVDAKATIVRGNSANLAGPTVCMELITRQSSSSTRSFDVFWHYLRFKNIFSVSRAHQGFMRYYTAGVRLTLSH